MQLDWHQRSFHYRIAMIASHILVFLGLRWTVFGVGILDELAYRDASLLPALGENLVTSPQGWTLLLGGSFFWRRASQSWQTLSTPNCLRWFATGVAFFLASQFASQGINLYFGQMHALERALLLVFALAIAIRPLFILPFLLIFIAYAGQFAFPIEGYGWDNHLLGIHRFEIFMLLAILGTFFIHFRGEEEPIVPNSTLYLGVLIIASFYFEPGIGKLRIGWPIIPTAHNSLFGAWSHGWLSWLSGENIAHYVQLLKPLAIPMQMFVIAIELGAVFALWRRCALILLPCWVIFHVGAWINYGFSFWSWMLVDLAVFLFILQQRDSFRFGLKECALGILLIGGSRFWLDPNRLAWFNARLTNTFHVVATLEDGSKLQVPPQALAPYDYIFTMQMFSGISNKQLLVGPYGATTSRSTAQSLGSKLKQIQRRTPNSQFTPRLTEQLRRLLHAYGTQWNAGRTNQSVFSTVSPPPVLNTTLAWEELTEHRIQSLYLERRVHVLTEHSVVTEVAQECLRIELGSENLEEPEPSP